MTTSALQSNSERSTFRFDDFFFSSMAVIILATVFDGFARSYYLAAMFHAPLPNVLVHIHEAIFTSLIVLLIAQTSLVAGGRVDLHRRLGLYGFPIACLMVVLGVMVATIAWLDTWLLATLESRTRPSMPSPSPTWGLRDFDLLWLTRAFPSRCA